jgi:hypothetical protein
MPDDEVIRMTCDRCGVFWELDEVDMALSLEILALHREDSCHPTS